MFTLVIKLLRGVECRPCVGDKKVVTRSPEKMTDKLALMGSINLQTGPCTPHAEQGLGPDNTNLLFIKTGEL